MKTRVFIFLLLMIMAFTAIYASEDPTEQEEYFRKKQELDLLADQFKAETGFTGEIQYNFEQMCLGVLEGKFSGITITSTADTTAFRTAFNMILDKVLPYSKATKSKLYMSKITSIWGDIDTKYYQIANGYNIEGAGSIKIGYDSGRNRFVVSDSAVDIPQINANDLIPKERAEEIALLDKNDARYRKARVKSTFYTNMGSNAYYLAYLVCVSDDSNPILGDYYYYIEALTGIIMTKYRANHINSDVTVRVMGNDYIESSIWSIPPTYYTEEPLKDVRVIVNPDSSQTDLSGCAYFYDVVDSTKTAKLTNSLFRLSCSSDTLNAISYTTASVDTLHHYTFSIPDNTYYASNAYIEAVNHVNGLIRLNETQDYFLNHLNITTFSTPPDPTAQTYGCYSPEDNLIWLRDG
ncbi:MAG: hypothetical protein PHO32_00535 [Candidatus Cloacimonetes bacterium]|nr:hypothetical protein [Candidatus Cloacimonadota bacterium]